MVTGTQEVEFQLIYFGKHVSSLKIYLSQIIPSKTIEEGVNLLLLDSIKKCVYTHMMVNNTFCNCISLRKASNNLTKIYDSALAKVDLKITQFSTLRNIQKLGNTNNSDLSYQLELDRTTVLRNLEKLIEMNLISYRYEQDNKNKIIQLTTVGKNKLREAIIIWKETQYKYIKALGIKNYKEIDTLITKISKINI